MDCVHLAEERNKWWSLVNTIMHLVFPKIRRISLLAKRHVDSQMVYVPSGCLIIKIKQR
jgi:hypothetical protein